MTSDNRPICEVLGEGHLWELADTINSGIHLTANSLDKGGRDAPPDEVGYGERRRGRRQRLQGDQALAEAGASAAGRSKVRRLSLVIIPGKPLT